MPAQHKAIPGALYERAQQFSDELEAGQVHAADQLAAAWADSYAATRVEIDALMAKIELAKVTGETPSPAWLYQKARLKAVLDTTKTEMAKYAQFTSGQMTAAQKAAMAAALKHAEKLTTQAVAEELPGLAHGFREINPENLKHLAGFLSNGSPLDDLLAAMPAQTAAAVRNALVTGVTLGKGTDWMVRKATEALGVARSRAETIVRTESLRAYRHASRASYLANADVVGGWVWHAHLDARCCVACVLMDGTEHPIDAMLDGHPRCRCAMVPRTKSWEDILGDAGKGIPDSRPPLRKGRRWLEAQRPHIQQAVLGKRKFQLWKDGQISLDDMVGRSQNAAWGTMRRERSIVEITEGRNPNWFDISPQKPVGPPPVKSPNPENVKHYADPELFSVDDLRAQLAQAAPGSQDAADLAAGMAAQLNKLEYGPVLPVPDPAKVKAAVEKLNKAVVTKGYPSKGYSQTKAIYKAQAQGEIGSKVGVVKELTWQHKINAQAILDAHDAELPTILEKIEKRGKVIADQYKHGADYVTETVDDIGATAKSIQAGLHGGLVKDDLTNAINLQQEIVDKATGTYAKAKEQAFLDGMKSKAEQYDDAVTGVKGKAEAGKTWVPPDDDPYKVDGHAELQDDGWVKITYHQDDPWGEPSDDIQWLDPVQGNAFLAQSNWVPKVDPDPKIYDAALGLLKGSDGYLNESHLKGFEDAIKTWNGAPSTKLAWQKAVAEAKATYLPKPNAQAVQNYLEKLKAGDVTEDAYQSLVDDPTLGNQSKSDLKAALEQYAEHKAIPIKADPAAVDALLDNMSSYPDKGETFLHQIVDGDLGVTDPQHIANAQAALDKLKVIKATEAAQAAAADPLAALVPGVDYSPDLVAKWLKDLENGDWTPDDLKSLIAEANPGKGKNAAMVTLKEWEAKHPPASLPTPDTGTVDELLNAIGEEEYFEGSSYAEKTLADWKDAVANPHVHGMNDQDVADYTEAIKQWEAKKGITHDTPDLPHVPDTPAPPPPPPPGSPTGPPFTISDLTDTGKVLGTHGARVYKDATTGERWLFKAPQNPSDGFLSDLDEIGSTLQHWAGNKAPDTYIVTLGGKRGSIQRMFDAEDGFPGGFDPAKISTPDLDMVTREHVLDWFMSNHDGHHEQFIRLTDGTMTAIDKGQAFRWFGQDKLDWNFHPNSHYGAPPPVYNRMWKDFAAGKDFEIDKGVLDQAIADVQAMDDTALRNLLRPYAEKAQSQGKLITPQRSFTGVDLKIASNDVDAFLDAVVQRKHDLQKDFDKLYDKAVKARQRAIPDWTPKKPAAPKLTGKAKWKDRPKPTPPPAPEAPAAQAEVVFTDWTDKVKAKYTAFSGKKLEDSHNWARVQRVIQEQDRSAVQELFDRNYLDAALRDEALALIDQAQEIKAAAQGAYDRALAAYEQAKTRWLADMKDWKEANGIVQQLNGMDEGALRYSGGTKDWQSAPNKRAVKWADEAFDHSKYTQTQRTWIKQYTGMHFRDWNKHLRSTKGNPTEYENAYKHIDAAMEKTAIPEDVILHRGAASDPYNGNFPFELDGKAFGEEDPGRMMQMVGSVQTDHGYGSTSVGTFAAFDHLDIQLKIRAPAGTPAAWVMKISDFKHERELVLGRGTRYFIHAVYKDGNKWVVEAEIVDADFDAALASAADALPSSKKWSLNQL